MMKAPCCFSRNDLCDSAALYKVSQPKKLPRTWMRGKGLENYGSGLHSGSLAQGHVMFLRFLVIVEGCHDFVHRSLLLNLILIILLVIKICFVSGLNLLIGRSGG
jgi:hypothetical protein